VNNDFWSLLKEVIKNFCAAFANKWQIRKRVIDTHLLVLFIFKLVLSKNQQGYKSLLIELFIRQKIRPGRHYPRRSRKPYTKWQSSNASKNKISIVSIGA